MMIEAIEQLTPAQIEELHRLYQLEWWTRGRQLADVERMVQNPDLIVAFCSPDSGELAAFARVLTDYVFKALIFDVIVAKPYRDQGLGRRLMDRIITHPQLGSVRHFELYCLPELVPFYQKWGFTEALGELRFLRRTL